jgi:RNA 3'-terminal phosphate cyclase (ATP)
MAEPLTVDGAHGEGGGQILRTALSLAAITGRAIRIENLRAGRAKPGLAAQHLTAVRAAAAVCGARLDGDRLGSTVLEFAPGGPVAAGAYRFDVAEAREGGSAGASALVLQTLLLPLALAAGASEVVIRGGTHVSRSPPFDYLAEIWLPVIHQIGIDATIELGAWGWYPAGQGEIRARIPGSARTGGRGCGRSS